MNNRRRILLPLLLALLLALVFTLFSCVNPTPPSCTSHTDGNGDGVCDTVGCNASVAPTPPTCTEHRDADGDGVCDTVGCGEPVAPVCTDHTDANGDGVCDSEGCNETVTPTPPSCTEHKDADSDGVCDTEGCGEAMEPDPIPEGAVLLVDGGVPRFQFVIQSGLYSDAVLRTDNLINELNKKLSKPVHRVDDRLDNHAVCEVILGTSRYREEKYSIDGHDYGYGGYAIKIVDSKIIIVGGSDSALLTALGIFTDYILKAAGDADIDDLYVCEDLATEHKITDYAVDSITIAGRPLSDLIIVADKGVPAINEAANALKDTLYLDAGVWLDITYPSRVSEDTPAIRLCIIPNTGVGNGYRVFVDEHGSLVFECEFVSSFADALARYVDEKLFPDGVKNVEISEDELYTENLRDIYYSDFGAVGDGVTDDFFAIKAAHDRANSDGHTVHADPDAVYYLGVGSGINTISIRTDTYWHGCKFIFDDHEIAPGSAEYRTPIFSIDSAYTTTSYTGSRLPITSIKQGAKNIGFAPGFRAMVTLHNDNVSHYIRYGPNQDSGNPQQEFVMVEADGTIDTSTPLQWDYDVITKITVKCVEDKSITVDGGGEYYSRTVIETIFNRAPSKYTYYQRNIHITRSNATVKSVEHIITGEIPESQGGTGAPYMGFTQISNCERSTVENFIFQRPLSYTTMGTGGTAGMGTYEMSASYANEPTWKNCTQKSFFESNGSVKYHGTMGTNYCRNLVFDGMFTCSFDAHKAAYNATIKNSTVEHLNFIGEGKITLENVTVYAESTKAAIVLRTDYGSTWEGELVIDGLDIRYSTAVSGSTFGVIKAEWTDHDFGYVCYLPREVTMKNVTLSCYSYSFVDGNRVEQTVSTNAKTLWLVTSQLKNITRDITKLTSEGGSANYNPYVGTKKVVVEDCPNLSFAVPDTPLFADTELWINGEKQ